MTQKIRIETDPGDLLSFLEEIDYPHRDWIEQHWMMDECIMVRVSDQFGTVGFFWAHWVTPGVLTAHAAAMPAAKIDWRNLTDDLDTIAYFLGADDLVLSFDQTPRSKALCRLAESLGFIRDDDNPYRLKLTYRRSTHGISRTETAAASEKDGV